MRKIPVNEQLARRTKGFLEMEEGRRLYQVAAKASLLGPCLEIGSYCGKSALFIGAACRENDAILFSIDHHHGSEEQQLGEQYFDPELYDPKVGAIDTLGYFRATLKSSDLEDWVVPLVCTSATVARAWATPLGMLFIDGGHAHKTVARDYREWGRHVLPGGFVVIHDIFENPEDGGQAPYSVYQEALGSGRYIEHPMTMSLGVLECIAG